MTGESMLARVERILVYAAIGVLFFSNVIQLPFVFPAGLGLLGLGLIAAGVQARLEGYISVWKRRKPSADDAEQVPLATWGIVLVLVGGALLLLALALVAGLDVRVQRVVSRFFDTDLGNAVILLVFGGGLIWWGVSSMRDFGKQEESALQMVESVPRRLFGVVLVLIGVIMMANTLLRLAAPQLADEMLTGLLNLIGRILNGL